MFYFILFTEFFLFVQIFPIIRPRIRLNLIRRQGIHSDTEKPAINFYDLWWNCCEYSNNIIGYRPSLLPFFCRHFFSEDTVLLLPVQLAGRLANILGNPFAVMEKQTASISHTASPKYPRKNRTQNLNTSRPITILETAVRDF